MANYQVVTLGDSPVPLLYLYNIGSAHGHVWVGKERFKEFLKEAFESNPDVKNAFCALSYVQVKEKQDLLELGFTETYAGKVDLYTIWRSKFFGEKAEEPVRNEEGRILNKDGTVRRTPYEYFAGDRIRFVIKGEEKVGKIRKVGDSPFNLNTLIKTRLHEFPISQIVDIVERVK